jgi:hypothetical protein
MPISDCYACSISVHSAGAYCCAAHGTGSQAFYQKQAETLAWSSGLAARQAERQKKPICTKP